MDYGLIITVMSGITTLAVGVIAWFMKGIFGDFKQATNKLQEHAVALAVHEEKINGLHNDLRQIRGLMREKRPQ